MISAGSTGPARASTDAVPTPCFWWGGLQLAGGWGCQSGRAAARENLHAVMRIDAPGPQFLSASRCGERAENPDGYGPLARPAGAPGRPSGPALGEQGPRDARHRLAPEHAGDEGAGIH